MFSSGIIVKIGLTFGNDFFRIYFDNILNYGSKRISLCAITNEILLCYGEHFYVMNTMSVVRSG